MPEVIESECHVRHEARFEIVRLFSIVVYAITWTSFTVPSTSRVAAETAKIGSQIKANLD